MHNASVKTRYQARTKHAPGVAEAQPSLASDEKHCCCAGADFVKGSRTVEGGGSTDLTPLRAAGNAFLGSVANRLFRASYSDITYGYNAFWHSEAERLLGGSDGFEGELLMPVRAVKADLNVAEVPCQEDARLHGKSTLRPFRDGW